MIGWPQQMLDRPLNPARKAANTRGEIGNSGSTHHGALKGANLRGQTEPNADFRRFSLIFADSCLFLENKAFGKRRLSQKTAENRRNPQKTADWRVSP